MQETNCYSANYFESRSRFREIVSSLDWEVLSYPIKAEGPNGKRLTIDVGRRLVSETAPTLFVTSGCHGVEGFFGAACQLAWLGQADRSKSIDSLNLVFLHALNPYGFAWLRRWNEDHVDLNRNFLAQNASYSGSHAAYERLNGWLNSDKPPGGLDLFYARAVCEILKVGYQRAAEAVAAGQYDFPGGLFYGGSQATESRRVVAAHIQNWLPAKSPVLHFDLHTGLGAWKDCQVLVDRQVDSEPRAWLDQSFRPTRIRYASENRLVYVARGGFGNWCAEQHQIGEAYFLCLEVGTYSGLRVLKELRRERALALAGIDHPNRLAAGEVLKEMFCPASQVWRRDSILSSVRLLNQGVQALANRYSD